MKESPADFISLKSGVIFNADDFGLAPHVNESIIQAAACGGVTSASLMVNMPYAEAAIQDSLFLWNRSRHTKNQVGNKFLFPENNCLNGVSNSCLNGKGTPEKKHNETRRFPWGVGLHFCLTSGCACSSPDEIPLLADSEGHFKLGFGGLARLVCSSQRKEGLRQIQKELAAQFQKFDGLMAKYGITPDHLDSHQHIHCLPGIFPLLLQEAQKRFLMLRIPHEHFGSLSRFFHSMAYRFPGGVAKKVILDILLSWNSLITQYSDNKRREYGTGKINTGKMQNNFRKTDPAAQENQLENETSGIEDETSGIKTAPSLSEGEPVSAKAQNGAELNHWLCSGGIGYFGILDTGRLDLATIQRILTVIFRRIRRGPQVFEINLHPWKIVSRQKMQAVPGLFLSQADLLFSTSSRRETEWNALVDPRFIALWYPESDSVSGLDSSPFAVAGSRAFRGYFQDNQRPLSSRLIPMDFKTAQNFFC